MANWGGSGLEVCDGARLLVFLPFTSGNLPMILHAAASRFHVVMV
jgi:hypothetical protein